MAIPAKISKAKPKATSTKGKRSSSKSKKGGKNYFAFILLLLFLSGGYFYLKNYKVKLSDPSTYRFVVDLQRTEKHYGEKISEHSKEFDLPEHYLKSLATLECSGKIEFTPRFEQHVYEELKKVRDKKKRRYGSIKRKDLNGDSDGALRNLATSWGPFQLMGYQCLELGVRVQDIRGKDNVYWGIYWINKRYGKVLRKGNYEDAFHIHNTGKPVPKNGIPFTHDPKYIEKGLIYMDYFNKHR